MHSSHIVFPSIAISNICRYEAFTFPCRDNLFVKIVCFRCKENVWCLSHVEVFEEGLASIYSRRHCRLYILYMCRMIVKGNDEGGGSDPLRNFTRLSFPALFFLYLPSFSRGYLSLVFE